MIELRKKIDIDEFKKWLKTRPKTIQLLAEKYPPNQLYKMKQGSPYGISCQGTIVEIYSYFESNDIGIIVFGDRKLAPALEHEKYLLKEHNRTDIDAEEMHKKDINVQINPEWLEPYKN